MHEGCRIKDYYHILRNKRTRLINATPNLRALGRTFVCKNCHDSLNNWPIFNPKPLLESSEAQLPFCEHTGTFVTQDTVVLTRYVCLKACWSYLSSLIRVITTRQGPTWGEESVFLQPWGVLAGDGVRHQPSDSERGVSSETETHRNHITVQKTSKSNTTRC